MACIVVWTEGLGTLPYLRNDDFIGLLQNFVILDLGLLGSQVAVGRDGQEVRLEEGQLRLLDVLAQDRKQPAARKIVGLLVSGDTEGNVSQDHVRAHHPDRLADDVILNYKDAVNRNK